MKAQPGRNSDALSRAIQPNKRQSDKTVSREILRHVHRALRSHRQILSKEELDKIGSYVSIRAKVEVCNCSRLIFIRLLRNY